MAVLTLRPLLRALGRESSGVLHAFRCALLQLLPRYELEPAVLDQKEARLPLALLVDSFNLAAPVSCRETLALRGARAWQLGDHGINDYLNSSSATLSAYLDRVVEFTPLLYDAARFTLRGIGEYTLLQVAFAFDVGRDVWSVEAVLGKVAVEARLALGAAWDRCSVAAHFAHPAPSYREQYAATFRTRLEFERGYDALVFRTSALAEPLLGADPLLQAFMLRFARTLDSQRPRRDVLLDRVRALLRPELARNGGAQQEVAARLGMTPLSLRRKLDELHGVGYAEVVSRVRRELAAELMSRSSLGVAQVARRAGYSNLSAFNRAFKRWFGCAPSQYRRTAKAHGLVLLPG